MVHAEANRMMSKQCKKHFILFTVINQENDKKSRYAVSLDLNSDSLWWSHFWW